MPPRYSAINHHIIELESNEELAKQFKRFENSPKFDLNSEEIYCVCRKPDKGELMIGCDGCDEWFHFKCMKINELYKDLIAGFYCKFCQWKGIGYTKWKRKCRNETCWQPVELGSKYCSKQCGLKFFQNLVDNKNNDKIKVLINKPLVEFVTLGSTFPELPEVLDIENNMDKFPDELKLDIKKIIAKLQHTKNEINLYTHKIELLHEYKNSIKLLNEKLTTIKKNKKIELCLYDKKLRDIDDFHLKQFNIDEIVAFVSNNDDTLYNQTCVQEKRKCPRHKGWINLLNDEFLNMINKYQLSLTELQEEERLLLRDYSISVYEK